MSPKTYEECQAYYCLNKTICWPICIGHYNKVEAGGCILIIVCTCRSIKKDDFALSIFAPQLITYQLVLTLFTYWITQLQIFLRSNKPSLEDATVIFTLGFI